MTAAVVPEPRRIVVMGVSGSGKTTVGAALAARIGARYIDADDLHDQNAITKMAAGIALTDADREPWLGRVGSVISNLSGTSSPVVVACSALRRRYRNLVREGAGADVTFIHLDVDEKALRDRMTAREGHFMPVGLLDSQLAILEPLGLDEAGLAVAATGELNVVLCRIEAALSSRDSSCSHASIVLLEGLLRR